MAGFKLIAKILGRLLGTAFLVLIVLWLFFFVGPKTPAEHPSWGVTFSADYARGLGLDADTALQALLTDMGVKYLRLIAPWNVIQPRMDQFDFRELDQEMAAAAEHNAKVILAVGMKTPRWPECHLPDWAKSLDQAKQQAAVVAYVQKVVERYKSAPALTRLQIENEPFLRYFGECPWQETPDFVRREIAAVKAIDPDHPVLITDSGEWSLLFNTASMGEVLGTTLYRRVFFNPSQSYLTYPFNPVFYARKRWLVQQIFHKDVINVELQAEPWGRKSLTEISAAEQNKTMDINQFKDIIQFAQDTGFNEFYLWGAEWWYYMKTVRNDASYWNEAKQLFAG